MADISFHKATGITRNVILSVRNVIDRIDRRLMQIEPQMTLIYERTENRYKLYGADALPVTIELDELLGLLQFLGTRRTDYAECIIMKRGKQGRARTIMYETKPLSKSKHFYWISKLEKCAREKLAKGVEQPAYFDTAGLLDDAKPAVPQYGTVEDPPEPDFALPELGLSEPGASREPLEHYGV